jgi:NitT/TauT family transport system permease protein
MSIETVDPAEPLEALDAASEAVARPPRRAPRRPSIRRLWNVHVLRGVCGVAAFFALWQLGVLLRLPLLAKIPTPLEVASAGWTLLHQPRYYVDWVISFRRVFAGFVIAQLLGVPLGLFMGWKSAFRALTFPVLEVLRPIPPLAWVPLSIVFWPTAEGSITFVIFLGAFFTVLINTMAGVRALDERYVRAAISLGASPAIVFRRIILPGALPSIFTGMTVGMGITWSVLVAAEIIAGRNGLGYMTWEGYVAGAFPIVIVGMVSIGVAGYLSSSLVRLLGMRAMPWTNKF